MHGTRAYNDFFAKETVKVVQETGEVFFIPFNSIISMQVQGATCEVDITDNNCK